MELIVAGVTPDNQSGVIRRESLAADQSKLLWATTENPPEIDRPNAGTLLAGRCRPGHTTWGLNYIPPNTAREMHRTDLLSYNVILSGAVELILETERVPLGIGDCLVLLGALHGWHTGSEGTTFAYTGIGLDPV